MFNGAVCLGFNFNLSCGYNISYSKNNHYKMRTTYE